MKINSHEVSKFGLSTKTLQNMQNFKLLLFSIQIQYIYKTKYRINSTFKQKLATKEMKEQKYRTRENKFS